MENTIPSVTQPSELAKRIAHEIRTLDARFAVPSDIDYVVSKHIAPLEAWKAAIEEAAVVNWTLNESNANDPRKAVSDLIACLMREALDPMFSQPAADLYSQIKTLRSCVQAWVDYFDDLASQNPGDPLSVARELAHGRRIAKCREALKLTSGS